MNLDGLSADISKAIEDLRDIEESILSLSRRERFGTGRRRISDAVGRHGFERRDARTVNVDSSGPNKRRLVVSAENDLYEGSDKRAKYDDREDEVVRRTVQSSVVMPTIETKSREAAITELKGTEKKEVNVRNRRMFSNLLLGTLQRFQKEEKKIMSVEKVQAEKQREVERRLKESEEEERERLAREKAALLEKRREKERLIKSLQRKKAVIQYAEQKQEHYRKLQKFIQTQAKPPIFYLPSKHTLRTLELLKISSKKIDELIEHRRLQMEADLKTPGDKQAEEGESDGEHSQTSATVRSFVKADDDTVISADTENVDKKPDIDDSEKKEVVEEVSMESSIPNFKVEGNANGDETNKQHQDYEEETGKANSLCESEPPGDEPEIEQDGDSRTVSVEDDY